MDSEMCSIEKNRKAIFSELDFYCKTTTNLEEIMNEFIGNEIMPTTKEEILSKKTDYKRNDKFFTHMTTKMTDPVMKKLLRVLNATGNKLVAQKLSKASKVDPAADRTQIENENTATGNAGPIQRNSTVIYKINGTFLNEGKIYHC